MPVFETVGSQNPLQGTSANLRPVGRLGASLAESLPVSSPAKQAEVRSFFPPEIMADLSTQSSERTGHLFFLLSQHKAGGVFFFSFDPC